MRFSLTLGKISGIPIYIHWSFSLIIFYFIYDGIGRGLDGPQLAWLIAYVLAIFGCVVLHELGHSFSARWYGIDTEDITLLPIGGVARLKSMPKEPWREIVVAIMGPMVNVAIAAGLFLYFYLLTDGLNMGQILDNLEGKGLIINQQNFLPLLFYTNVFLVIFNAIPAFPMDGGRVLRGLLGLKFRRVTATKIAMYLGRIFAILFAIASFMPGGNPFLILIALFIFFAARQEYQSVRTEAALAGKTVGDIMRTNYTLIDADSSIEEAIPIISSSEEQMFLVVRNGVEMVDLVGIVSRKAILDALNYHRSGASFLEKYSKRKAPGTHIHQLMLNKIRYLSPQKDLMEAYQEMIQIRLPMMPIFSSDTVVGVVDYYQIKELVD